MHEHHPHHRFTPGPWNRPWPPDITPTIALGEGGLTMGAGTRLVRMAAPGRLALSDFRSPLRHHTGRAGGPEGGGAEVDRDEPGCPARRAHVD